jgi:hypothetical protein
MVLVVGAAAHVSIRVSIVQPAVLEGRNSGRWSPRLQEQMSCYLREKEGTVPYGTERGEF